MTEQLKQAAQQIGATAEYWGNLAQQKADADAKRGVSMPVSYYASTVVGALLAANPALTAAQPEQAGEVDERVAFIEWLETTWPKCYPKGTGTDYWRNGHLSALAWKAARASLPTQPAAQTDSMGMPTSCGKPLCLPDEHHPLCKLHKPAAQDTPEPTVTYATVRAAYDELHIECRFSDGQKFAAVTVAQGFDNLAHRIETMLNESQQATPEPVGAPWAHLWQHDETGRTKIVMADEVWTASNRWHYVGPLVLGKTHQAPGVPEGWALVQKLPTAGWSNARGKQEALVYLNDALAAAQAKGGE